MGLHRMGLWAPLGALVGVLCVTPALADPPTAKDRVRTIPSANPPSLDKVPEPSAGDVAWNDLLNAKEALVAESAVLPAEGGKRAAAKQNRAKKFVRLADHAKDFYSNFPTHYWAGEARRLEIVVLVRASEDGDSSRDGRLEKAVEQLRKDSSVSAKTRAMAVSEFEISKAMRQASNERVRRSAVERAARAIVKEFPKEDPGYQTLLALAKGGDAVAGRSLAAEIVASNAGPEIKRSAQRLIDRGDLVGKKLRAVLGANAEDVLAKLPAGQPVLVYSWSASGSGSLQLGRMIQARRFAAIGVCLDTQLEDAFVAQQSANLGGVHVYDPKGGEGVVAEKLKFSEAGQIYLIDSTGLITDVRGGDDLEAKLTALGFKTPELKKP